MNNESHAKEWFDYAIRDLDSAKFLMDMDPRPLEIICYHCQQSAEKFLKGSLVILGIPIQKTHDLTLLCKLCESKNDTFKEIIESCIDLVDFGVQARYPYQLDIDLNDTINAINSAELIKNFVFDRGFKIVE